MNQEDKFRIQHMIDASEEALSFIKNVNQNDFFKSRILILSVIKEIEIVGEAASKISNETIQENPVIPWKDIVGMRNRLIHGYFEVNIDLVWNTLTINLPALIKLLKELLQKS